MIGRLVISLAISFSIFLLTLLEEKHIENIYGLVAISSFIPYTCAFFLTYSVCDTICLNLKLYDRVKQAD